MKHANILRPLGIAVALALLTVVIPASPVLAAPVITLSPTSAPPGAGVTVTGTNFESYIGDTVSIFFNDVEIVDSPKVIPEAGGFEVYFDVPDNALPGIAQITVKSQLGAVLAQGSFVIPTPTIMLDIYQGAVGTEVTATASGFYADKIVGFYYAYNGMKVKVGSAVAGSTGQCSGDLVIPPSIAGRHVITAENAQGHVAQVQFHIIPAATLTSTSGTVDEIVTVNGTGFGSANGVTIYLGTTVLTFTTTDGYGSFEAAFRVPVMQAGAYDLRIIDQSINVVGTVFTITATAELSESTGNVGTALALSGNSFTPGAAISVKYDDTEVATVTADDAGAFSAAFNAPASSGGSHLITISDGTNSAQITFTMESTAPSAPTMLIPETDAGLKSPVTFQWQAVVDPSLPVVYNLQVASDADFTTVVLEKEGLTDSEYTPTAEEALEPSSRTVPYYWRVKAVDGASNESEWSTPVSFRVVSPTALPIWAIYALIGVGVLVIGFVAFRLLKRETPYARDY